VPFVAGDFYEDAVEAVAEARRTGRRVGVAGNFGEDVAMFVRGNLDVDFVASSEAWGVRKPDGAFFARVSELAKSAPQDVMYVGDRIDNDVLPALAAGMQAVFVVRGPWAHVQKGWLEARGRPATVVHDLRSLPL
jgi:FMN phosphatase YigB (HAD superfamily)